jgi:hypothetical protein
MRKNVFELPIIVTVTSQQLNYACSIQLHHNSMPVILVTIHETHTSPGTALHTTSNNASISFLLLSAGYTNPKHLINRVIEFCKVVSNIFSVYCSFLPLHTRMCISPHAMIRRCKTTSKFTGYSRTGSPPNGTCFLSTLCCQEFVRGYYVFGKLLDPQVLQFIWTELMSSTITNHKMYHKPLHITFSTTHDVKQVLK